MVAIPPSSPPRECTQGYTLLEEILHSVSHGIGAVLSVAGMTALIVAASIAQDVDPWKLVGVSLYGITLVGLYTASTLYHGSRHPRLKQALQIADHCAIYALIAGTYTPFLLVNLRDGPGWPMLAAVWTLALSGIALKILWPQRFSALRVIMYLAMGWLAALAAGEFVATLSPTSLVLLISGGVIYSLGVIVFVIEAIPYNHAIWHGFVLAGSGCHYAAVYTGVLPFAAV
ncbi:PAQR family membrane homeostasis protein TrhA [Onishia niordana]|uniref:PAQR family membrane homeostasis protein TrhA n=1 Tax=Onishia niordana TaxID=2508711 RepID=UPI00109F514F|nr:hemolysin III family protein [Halomonas niordiana]